MSWPRLGMNCLPAARAEGLVIDRAGVEQGVAAWVRPRAMLDHAAR